VNTTIVVAAALVLAFAVLAEMYFGFDRWLGSRVLKFVSGGKYPLQDQSRGQAWAGGITGFVLMIAVAVVAVLMFRGAGA